MAENQVQNPQAEKVIALSASLLEPFQGHPFRVVSGEEITPAAIVLMQRYGIEELSVLR